jgi:acetyl esterase/lipase
MWLWLPVMSDPTTVVFKTTGATALHADVYRARGRGPRPAILWLHGGALIFGDRGMIPRWQLERYREAGYSVVAIDYRLAPETKLPEILSDVISGIAWAREEGSRRFAVDPARLAIVGHSAGGYLTLLAGSRVSPLPQALISFYGYGDIIGDWYTTPSPYYCQFPAVSAAEAWSVVDPDTAEPSAIASGGSGAQPPDRSRLYLYSRQQGCWPQLVAGLDPMRQRQALLGYCPVQHVTANHPPTLLLHGDADTDVPYAQSQIMASALATAGAPHRLLTIANGEHVFDARAEDPTVQEAFAQVLAFLAEHV